MILLILAVFVLSYSFVIQPHSEPTSEFYDSGTITSYDGNTYNFVRTENGYELYDASGQFIGITEIED